jgi:hypothetical protein
VERTEADAKLATEEHVGSRGEIVAQGEVLINDLHASFARLNGPVEHGRPAVDRDRAVSWSEITGNNPHERRLAGPVVAHQAHDLATPHGH